MISEYYLNYYRSIVSNIIAEKPTSRNLPEPALFKIR
jgi:hypothetical protein